MWFQLTVSINILQEKNITTEAKNYTHFSSAHYNAPTLTPHHIFIFLALKSALELNYCGKPEKRILFLATYAMGLCHW